jgi:uncharacterized protein YueI
MSRDSGREALQAWTNKSELEKALTAGIHGAPEIKKDEKRHYLGVFREQVIAILSTKQIKEAVIYPEIAQALKDKRSAKLIINGSINNCFTKKYQLLSKKSNKPYTVVADPDYAENTGLVIASNEAVDIEHVDIEDREGRLRKLGTPETLIQSAGKKVCAECLQQILKIDPREKINYDELTWIERIMGEDCPAHDKDSSK